MIVKAIFDLLHSLATALFGWLRDNLPAAPEFWEEATTAVTTVFGQIGAPIRWFVPIEPLLTAGVALLSLYVLLGAIRLVRRVVSLFTGGGGMA